MSFSSKIRESVNWTSVAYFVLSTWVSATGFLVYQWVTSTAELEVLKDRKTVQAEEIETIRKERDLLMAKVKDYEGIRAELKIRAPVDARYRVDFRFESLHFLDIRTGKPGVAPDVECVGEPCFTYLAIREDAGTKQESIRLGVIKREPSHGDGIGPDEMIEPLFTRYIYPLEGCGAEITGPNGRTALVVVESDLATDFRVGIAIGPSQGRSDPPNYASDPDLIFGFLRFGISDGCAPGMNSPDGSTFRPRR